MSIMKGKLRRSAVVVAFALGAFQALSIVGANVASAAVGDVQLQRRRAYAGSHCRHGERHFAGRSREHPGGRCADDEPHRRRAASLAANVGNTTAINITGPAGVSSTDESVAIQTYAIP